MNYPLQLRFKILALSPQMYVQDASGGEVCYVKQKLFRLREKVEVFTDSSRRTLLSTIQADRIIDFNAHYAFTMADGTRLGSVRRRGMRSIWRANYEILDGAGSLVMSMHEENPGAKLLDSVLGEIPIVGLFTGFFCHPRYSIKVGENVVARVTKSRSFLESRFVVEQVVPLDPQNELRMVHSLLMFVLMERSRG
jgi:uncharacterized protein YxjI